MDREREAFIFYRSFAEAVGDLEDPDTELKLYRAIIQYGLSGTLPELSGAAKAVMRLIKPQIDANQRRYENGTKGGKPKANRTETKPEPKPNQKQTKTEPKPNQSETTAEPKEKEKDKDKEKENEKELSRARTRTEPTFPHGEFLNVFLTVDQYANLGKRYGTRATDEYIGKLSNYIESRGAKYKSHYAVLLQWLQKDKVPEIKQGGSDLAARALEQLKEAANQ